MQSHLMSMFRNAMKSLCSRFSTGTARKQQLKSLLSLQTVILQWNQAYILPTSPELCVTGPVAPLQGV